MTWEESEADLSDTENLVPSPPSSQRRRQRLKHAKQKTSLVTVLPESDDDEWSTLFFNEDWTRESEDESDEVRPVNLERPPILPRFVKRVGGSTDLRSLADGREEDEDTGRGVKRDIGTEAAILEVPLTEMDASRRLMQAAGISSTDLILINDCGNIYGVDKDRGDSQNQEDLTKFSLIPDDESANESNASVVSLLQRKYEKRAKRRLKSEALHELSLRVQQRLSHRYPRDEPLPVLSSHSSLTSDGGDFELNLPNKFYRQIRASSRKRDELRRRKFMGPMIEALQEIQEPALYLIKKGKKMGNLKIQKPLKLKGNKKKLVLEEINNNV